MRRREKALMVSQPGIFPQHTRESSTAMKPKISEENETICAMKN